jgi:hypothetical protein
LGPAAGTNTVTAVVSGVGMVSFTATAVSPAPRPVPSRMVFRVQPTDLAGRHQIISPPVEVEVLDQFGNRVTDQEFTITLDLIEVGTGRNPGHDSRRTRSGLAVYPDLRINGAGVWFLRATARGLPSVDSEPFVVHE